MITILDQIYDVSGLSADSPGEIIINREDLNKIIDRIGIKNTLNWINGENFR